MAFLIILIVLVFFFTLWIGIRVRYNDADGLSVSLCILFFSFKIYPRPPKKVKTRDYTAKAIEKRRRKEEKKKKIQAEKDKQKALEKDKKKSRKIEKGKGDKAGGRTFHDLLTLFKQLTRILFLILRKFFCKYLHVDISRLCIIVAAEDPAKAAVLYGGVCTAVSCLMQFLADHAKVRRKRGAKVGVAVDFLRENFSADVDITVRLQVWHPFGLVIHAIRELLTGSKDSLDILLGRKSRNLKKAPTDK